MAETSPEEVTRAHQLVAKLEDLKEAFPDIASVRIDGNDVVFTTTFGTQLTLSIREFLETVEGGN